MEASTHVLVVEHQDDVRETICELLVDLGYRVTVAKDADRMRAALDLGPTDLIVLDATVSSTEELSLAIQVRNRGIRLVMISGNPALMKEFHDRADQLLHNRSPGSSRAGSAARLGE